jgi:hypothetical protein
MKNIPARWLLIAGLLITTIVYSPVAHTSAQIGIKGGLLVPYGDIGQFFNKTSSFEIFGINEFDEGQFRMRMGLFYAKFTSRLDTFPIYAVTSDPMRPNLHIVPGYLVNNKFRMYGINADFSVRLFNVKGFSTYAGAGLQAGIAHVESVKDIETVIHSTNNSDYGIGGFRVLACAQYKLSGAFDLFGDWAYNFTSDTHHTTKFTHAVYSLGVNFYFDSDR